MSLETYTVFNGANNAIQLALTDDGTTLDHTTLTRMVLEVGVGDTLLSADPHTSIDSDVNAAYFDFTNAGYVGLLLGAAGLAVGRHFVRMTVYNAAHPTGVKWEPMLELRVV